MMMMQGILPALDPDAMLNLAISMSMQEGVCINYTTILCMCTCVCVYVHFLYVYIPYTRNIWWWRFGNVD